MLSGRLEGAGEVDAGGEGVSTGLWAWQGASFSMCLLLSSILLPEKGGLAKKISIGICWTKNLTSTEGGVYQNTSWRNYEYTEKNANVFPGGFAC